jgi:hypothetical protein
MSKASNPVLDMNSILSPSRTLLLSCCLLLASLLPLSAYTQNSAQPKQAPQQNTAVSEDVQRFLGFEKPVLFRYLSVPYDVSMTRNVNLYTIDIGFFLLLLVPLALVSGAPPPRLEPAAQPAALAPLPHHLGGQCLPGS